MVPPTRCRETSPNGAIWLLVESRLLDCCKYDNRGPTWIWTTIRDTVIGARADNSVKPYCASTDAYVAMPMPPASSPAAPAIAYGNDCAPRALKAGIALGTLVYQRHQLVGDGFSRQLGAEKCSGTARVQ